MHNTKPKLHYNLFSRREGDKNSIHFGEVRNLMQSFQRMIDAMTNQLNREANGNSVSHERSTIPLGDNPYRELKKVKFHEYCDNNNLEMVESRISGMTMFFTLHDCTTNHKSWMTIF
jgi:hypothetical protein